MTTELKCYIGGQWKEASGNKVFRLLNPATEELTIEYKIGNTDDVNKAVACARKAFETFSQSSLNERIELLKKIAAGLQKKQKQLAQAITLEMGSPSWFAEKVQAPLALGHAMTTLQALQNYQFEEKLDKTVVGQVPIGVCGMITPWNWPAGLVMSKLAPALAVGCTVILKPASAAPFSAAIIAEVMHDAGLPKGVFNLVYGDGSGVGSDLARHPQIDCISFTGSTKAGVDVARHAAASVKRVVQELGGKSPNIILPSADIAMAVKAGVKGLMSNSGQTCSAPSRMLVHKDSIAEVKRAVKDVIGELQPGPPDSGAFMGPVVNENQYERIQSYIRSGIDEGATVLVGGLGKPKGMLKGYYVQPTVFTETKPTMKIVREEIFGPVLVIQEYDSVGQAIEMANDTNYGLAAYVQGKNLDEVRKVAEKINAGQVYCNTAGESADLAAPFGGFKQSGNGREWGSYGFADYLEYKALIGYETK